MSCDASTPNASLCPLCGRANECQLCSEAESKGPCWCSRLEIPDALLAQVPAESRGTRCICRSCVLTFLSQKYKMAVVPANQPGDFYFDDNGLLVFTAAYLKRRGYCCESGCRHCPYRGAITPA